MSLCVFTPQTVVPGAAGATPVLQEGQEGIKHNVSTLCVPSQNACKRKGCNKFSV